MVLRNGCICVIPVHGESTNSLIELRQLFIILNNKHTIYAGNTIIASS